MSAEPRCDQCGHWGGLQGNEFRSDGSGAKGFLKLSSGRLLGRCCRPGGHAARCRDGTMTESDEGAPTYASGPLSHCLTFEPKP